MQQLLMLSRGWLSRDKTTQVNSVPVVNSLFPQQQLLNTMLMITD